MSGVYKLEIAGIGPTGDFWENVLNFQLTEDGALQPVVYAERLVTAWIADNQANFLAATPNDAQLTSYTAKRLGPGGGISFIRPATDIGTHANPTLATACAMDVVWLPASGYNHVGHMYKCPAPGDGIVEDQLQTPWTTEVETMATGMLPPMTLSGGAGTATLVIYSRKTNIAHQIVDFSIRPKPTFLNKRSINS